MYRSLHRPFIALALVALWILPVAAILTLGLHVSLDHHASVDGDHGRSIAELVQAAVHGHHHDVVEAPTHEHPAIAGGTTLATRSGLSSQTNLYATATFLTEALTDGSWALARAARSRPPDLLFFTLCSLLL